MWDRVSFVREFREARAVAKLVSTSGKRETSDSNQIQNSKQNRRIVVVSQRNRAIPEIRKVDIEGNETF